MLVLPTLCTEAWIELSFEGKVDECTGVLACSGATGAVISFSVGQGEFAEVQIAGHLHWIHFLPSVDDVFARVGV